MVNDRRRFWTTLIFILLLAPAVVTLLLTLLTPAPTTHPAQADRNNTNPISAILPPLNPTLPVGTRAKDAPLLAAGDGRHLWVVHPFELQEKENGGGVGGGGGGVGGKLVPVYELLRRTGNTGVWTRSTNYAAIWRNHPQGLAVMPMPQVEGQAFVPGVPYVFSEGGGVDRYTVDSQSSAESLPPGQMVKAATGALQGLFALALGPVPTAATRPGDRLRPELEHVSLMDPFGSMMPSALPPSSPPSPRSPSASQRSSPSTTRAASSPASTAPSGSGGPESQPAATMNAYWLRDNHWILLPPLGQASGDPSNVPTPTSNLALVVQETDPAATRPATQSAGHAGGRLLAMWVDPTRPGELFVRTLSLAVAPAEMAWSGPVVCRLPEQVPGLSRLFAVQLEGKVSIFWTVPTGATIELHGGTLVPQAGAQEAIAFKAGGFAAMSLGSAGQGVRPELDVALGTGENSLLAVVATKEGLSSLSFSDVGQLMAGPTPVEPHSPAADVQVGRNIGMIILVLVFALSLWQWRQKPIVLAIPADFVPAPLYLRAIAFAIDAAIPFLIVITAFGELGNAMTILSAWLGSSSHPEELLHLPEFFSFLGLYLTYCSLGELFFRRTVGKAIVGLQVRMNDGKPPTLAAVLLRNLIRLPEVSIGIILFILISENRQRFGDLLARTIVLAKKPPEVPANEDEPPTSPPEEPRG